MRANAITRCPEETWIDTGYANKFWHLAYHAVFYTHLYMQPSETELSPWPWQRCDYQFLGSTPRPPFERPKLETPCNKEEILDFHKFCREGVEVRMRSLDLAAPSGFHRLPCNKLELQLYNLRHLQHHTGQLIERREECEQNRYRMGTWSMRQRCIRAFAVSVVPG